MVDVWLHSIEPLKLVQWIKYINEPCTCIQRDDCGVTKGGLTDEHLLIESVRSKSIAHTCTAIVYSLTNPLSLLVTRSHVPSVPQDSKPESASSVTLEPTQMHVDKDGCRHSSGAFVSFSGGRESRQNQ